MCLWTGRIKKIQSSLWRDYMVKYLSTLIDHRLRRKIYVGSRFTRRWKQEIQFQNQFFVPHRSASNSFLFVCLEKHTNNTLILLLIFISILLLTEEDFFLIFPWFSCQSVCINLSHKTYFTRVGSMWNPARFLFLIF